MIEKYKDMVNSFRDLDIEDKRKEIIKRSNELLKLLYVVNKELDSYDEVLPILNGYTDEDTFLDLIFSYLISIREENAKMIENMDNK